MAVGVLAKESTMTLALLSAFLLFCMCPFSPFSVNAHSPAAWPATSYSPYFQNLFAHAQFPVAALPSGPGAQAPAIPIPGLGPAPVRFGIRRH